MYTQKTRERPAAQAQGESPTIAVGEPNPSTPAPTPEPATPQSAQDILAQVAAAIGPILSRDVLPVLQADHGLQERMATAAGRAAAQELKPWVMLAAGSIAAYVVYKIVKSS